MAFAGRFGGWARGLVGVGLLGALALSGLATRRALPPTMGADSPMLSTLLVALGGSRGIIAEVLWWRIGDLQRQNRYAELVPLTDLLVTLEPSSPDVWAYNAWNLAYNISVMHQDPEDRWRWVRRTGNPSGISSASSPSRKRRLCCSITLRSTSGNRCSAEGSSVKLT